MVPSQSAGHRGTHRTPVRRLVGAVTLAVTLLGMSLVGTGLVGTAALALPPDGAGPDTAGTSSRVWPTEVKPGDTLNFEVSGYPANETVYIKIDDGEMCDDTSHGACVYAMQKLDGSGYASGSIIVPELANGAHWLRMLATGDQFDSRTGENIGYKGYTRRGGNDFTVVGSSGTGGSSGSGTSSSIEGGNIELNVDAGEESSIEDQMVNISEGEEARLAEAVSADASDAASADAADGDVPVLGIAVLGGSVLLGGAVLAWALISRKRRANTETIIPDAGADADTDTEAGAGHTAGSHEDRDV